MNEETDLDYKPPGASWARDIALMDPPIRDEVKVVRSQLILNEVLPGLVQGEPTAMLLDTNNLFGKAASNNFAIDYRKLRSVFDQRCDLRHAAVFAAIDRQDEKGIAFANYVRNNGYMGVFKNLSRSQNPDGSIRKKGNMDVDLTIHAMKLSEGFAHVIIGSCDGDFTRLVEELQSSMFRKVSVLGIRDRDQSGMSEALVRQADNFYDMNNFVEHIRYAQR